VSYEVLVR